MEVVAVCSRRPEPARRVAADFGVPSVYSDLRAMLAEQTLDAVVIATPPNVMAAQAAASLLAGLDVLAEKPLATNRRQLDELGRALKESGRNLIVAYTRRYRRAWMAARDWVSKNKIGSLRTIECLWRGPYRERYSSNGLTYRADPAQRVAGVLLDSGSHALDAVLYMTGMLGNVTQAELARDGTDGADISGMVSITQPSGVKVLLDFQSVLQDEETKFVRVTGDAGSIEIGDHSARLRTEDGSTSETVDEYMRRPVDDLSAVRDGECTFGASSAEAGATVLCLLQAYTLARQPLNRDWQRPRAKAWGRLNGAC